MGSGHTRLPAALYRDNKLIFQIMPFRNRTIAVARGPDASEQDTYTKER